MAVHERRAEGKILRHADHRLVDGGVAVRVVLAHHLADDGGALAVAGVRREPEVGVHRVQDPALDGLEAVADVGERAAGDDRERVVEVAAPGGLVEGDGLYDVHLRSNNGPMGLSSLRRPMYGGAVSPCVTRGQRGDNGFMAVSYRLSATGSQRSVLCCNAPSHPHRHSREACLRAGGGGHPAARWTRSGSPTKRGRPIREVCNSKRWATIRRQLTRDG